MDQYQEICSLGKLLFRNAEVGLGTPDWQTFTPEQKRNWMTPFYYPTGLPPELNTDDHTILDDAYGQIVANTTQGIQPLPPTTL